MVAAAIIGGAAVGAIGSGVAGHSAAKATEHAADASVQAQREALEQQERLSAPYRQLGEAAIPQLRSLLGLPPATPSATGSPAATPMIPGRPHGGMAGAIYNLETQPGGRWAPTPGGGVQPIMSVGPDAPTTDPLTTLRNLPGYQFALREGLDATKNAASAMGLSLSGNTLEGLDRFSTGLADQTYGNEVARLQGIVDIGQASAAGQAANVGSAANNISSTLIGQGNNIAGINANTIAGITKAIGSGFDQYGEQQTLQGLINQQGAGAIDYVTPTVGRLPVESGTTTYFGP